MIRGVAFAFVVSFPGSSAVANAQPSPGVATAALAKAFSAVAQDLQAAADQMPAESYGFRPVSGVQSFGQMVAHVAGGNFLYCSQASGTRLTPELAKRLNAVRPFSDVETESGAPTFGKADLVALLRDSIGYCEGVYAAGTGAADALIGNIAHDNHHYGNLVTYLRLEGLVPPSTERRSKKSPQGW